MKFRRSVTLVALGLAVAVPAAWFAVRSSEPPERMASREAPRVDATTRVDAGTSAPIVPASPQVTSRFVPESTWTASSDAGVAVRQAIDSGRAQPLFIGLTAPDTVRVGEPFAVEVTGESENDFARVALTIRFDPRVLRVATARQGDLMAQAGSAAAFSYAVDAQTGRVSIELNENEGGNPVSGGGTLCTLEFVAIAPGRAVLSIPQVAVGDLNNESVAYSVLPSPIVAVRE